MIECLCNGCLRVSYIDAEPENGEALCEHCGWEMCWCGRCMDTLAKLRAGIRDPKQLHMQRSSADWTWSETDGLKNITVAFR